MNEDDLQPLHNCKIATAASVALTKQLNAYKRGSNKGGL
jgi:hypothetical protein